MQKMSNLYGRPDQKAYDGRSNLPVIRWCVDYKPCADKFAGRRRALLARRDGWDIHPVLPYGHPNLPEWF